MGFTEQRGRRRGLVRGARAVARPQRGRAAVHLLFCAALIAAAVAPADAGVFHRPTLGREDLPAEETLERSQAGRLEVGRFIPSGLGAAASRPDSTGTGGQFYRLSLLDAFRGNRMGFLMDGVAITDRDRHRAFFPTQGSYLIGIGSRNGPWRIQFDREEHLPLDRSGGSSRYWDVRAGATFEAELAGLRPLGVQKGVRYQKPKGTGATLRGEFGIGYFLHNKSFPARADQTGLAGLRYEVRALISAPGGGLRLKADADFLTDKNRKKFEAANLDLVLGVGIASKQAEIWFERYSADVLDGPGYEHYYLLKFVLPYAAGK
jgi:hypothetical protein